MDLVLESALLCLVLGLGLILSSCFYAELSKTS